MARTKQTWRRETTDAPPHSLPPSKTVMKQACDVKAKRMQEMRDERKRVLAEARHACERARRHAAETSERASASARAAAMDRQEEVRAHAELRDASEKLEIACMSLQASLGR